MDREVLEEMLERGATLAEVADEAGVDRSTARRWLMKAGLKTARMETLERNIRERADGIRESLRFCDRHGQAMHRLDARGTYRCAQCNIERVTRRRRSVKETLVLEAGGACALCGYDRCIRALSFHHLDPATKEFNVSLGGQTRSIERARAEAAKCVLLCANCHMEVESGLSEIALQSGTTIRGSSIGRAAPC